MKRTASVIALICFLIAGFSFSTQAQDWKKLKELKDKNKDKIKIKNDKLKVDVIKTDKSSFSKIFNDTCKLAL